MADDDDYDDTMAYTYHDLTIIRFALRSSSSFVVLFLSVHVSSLE